MLRPASFGAVMAAALAFAGIASAQQLGYNFNFTVDRRGYAVVSQYDLLAQPQLGYARCVVHIHRRNEQRDSRNVEGTVANTCCGTVSEVIGLVRQAAAPTFQSNCFIFNQEPRAGRIVLTLASGDGQVVASQIVDVKAMEFIRLLDVFAALNAPPGDVDNVRATFESIVPVAGGA